MNTLSEVMSTLQDDLCRGLLYSHDRLNDNTKKILEAASFLYALIEMLEEKGLISIGDLDARKKLVAERLVRKFTESGLGLMYQEPEYDKYAFEHTSDMDCEARLAVCRAVCCKFPFALSRQDVEEGVIQWEFGRPYLIAHGGDGYCLHLDRKTLRCRVHEKRPVPCRGFDCRDNQKWKVWEDFGGMVLNRDLARAIDEDNERLYCRARGVR